MIQYIKQTALAVFVLTATSAGCSKSGYNERCEQVIAPIREEFARVCESRIDITLETGSLDRVVQKREQALAAENCPKKEKWFCGRGNYFGPDGGSYKMVVE